MPDASPEPSQTPREDAADAQPGAIRERGRGKPVRRIVLGVGLVAILAAGHLAVMWSATQTRRGIEWDEFGWLAASDAAFRLMLVDRAGGSERWHEGFQATTYGAMSPNFAKLVMGLALHCWGYDLAPPAFFPRLGPGHPRYDELRPAQRRHMAAAHIPFVVKLRWLVLLTSTAAAVALYFVGRAISGPVLGIAAYVAFVFTPLVKELAFAVYSDNLLLLMSLLSVLATVRFVRWWRSAASVRPVWRAAGGLFGIAMLYGAAVSTKYNGALVCIACVLAVVVVWGAGRFARRRAWQTAAALIGTGAVAFGVFVLLNPQLQDGVFGRIAWTASEWRELIARQQEEFRGTYAITTFGGRVGAVYHNAVLGTGPLAHVLPIGAAILGGLGFIVTMWRCVWAVHRSDDLIGPTFLVAWALVMVVLTTLWLPLDWPRYYLPLVPVLCLLQAVPIEVAWRVARRWRRHYVARV